MPQVLDQSASCSRNYACFTEEWPVCLAKRSCRGDEGISIDGAPLASIDGTPLASIDGVSRMQAEYIL